MDLAVTFVLSALFYFCIVSLFKPPIMLCLSLLMLLRKKGIILG